MTIINIQAYQDSLFIWSQTQQKFHTCNSRMLWAVPLPQVHVIMKENTDSTEQAFWVHILNQNNPDIFFCIIQHKPESRHLRQTSTPYGASKFSMDHPLPLSIIHPYDHRQAWNIGLQHQIHLFAPDQGFLPISTLLKTSLNTKLEFIILSMIISLFFLHCGILGHLRTWTQRPVFHIHNSDMSILLIINRFCTNTTLKHDFH